MKYLRIFSAQKIFLLIALFCSVAMYGQKSRIQGRIFDDRKQPLAGVLVIDKDTKEVLSASDDDGNYSALVSKNHALLFESIGCKTREILVKGRQIINVTLETEVVKLPDVEVVSKIVNKVIPEPTEIEVKGNYFHMRTRVRVPKEMAKSNTRLIIQPYITDVTARKRGTMTPLVMDGREYGITQKRMYDYDIQEDPLSPYLYQKDPANKTNMIPYHDSIYIEHQEHDYRGEVLISLENYNTAFYTDSFIIAKGTVNPLRFFQYDLPSNDLRDSAFIPKPALQLRNDKGEVQLVFKTGKAEIDLNMAENRTEVDRLKGRLASIEKDPNSDLQSFEIFGVASPDGNYSNNTALAKKRMQHAADAMLSQLNKDTRQFLKIKSDASVATWEMVADLMEADSATQAAEIRKIIKTYPGNINRQSREIKKLSSYAQVIASHYLPRLRKVSYQFEYSLFRSLNNDEIQALYQQDPNQLSRYEFYRMFEMTQDGARLRVLYDQALALYPKFLLAANRLAMLNLSENKADEKVLEPFVKKDAPREVLMNQVLTLLQKKQYTPANEIMSWLPQTADTDELRGIVSIFNGNYEPGYSRIAERGGVNEVLLLLAMKRNEEAFEKALKLSEGVALHEYVRAIAANRLDKVGNALMYLESAFALDPHFREIASIDGDVNNLLE